MSRGAPPGMKILATNLTNFSQRPPRLRVNLFFEGNNQDFADDAD